MRFRNLVASLMSGSMALDPTLPPLETQSEADAQADVHALEAGRLPPSSVRRVQRSIDGVWGSTLDIPDLYLAETFGIEPVSLVTGQSLMHAETNTRRQVLLDGENHAAWLIRAYYQARDNGFARLIAEAQMAGAHAVIGAVHQFSAIPEDRNAIQFSIYGTAVRFKGVPPSKNVLVSPMSGEAFFKLLHTGFMPVDFAFGYDRLYMPVGFNTKMVETSLYNQELTSMADRFNQTRMRAVQIMSKDARRRFSVDGIVGVEVRTEIEESEITYSGQSSVTVDGSTFYREENGLIEVPAMHLEFFVTGACIRRVSKVALGRADISAYLATL